MITVGPVFVTVLPPRTAKLLAVPRFGSVAANASHGVASKTIAVRAIVASSGLRATAAAIHESQHGLFPPARLPGGNSAASWRSSRRMSTGRSAKYVEFVHSGRGRAPRAAPGRAAAALVPLILSAVSFLLQRQGCFRTQDGDCTVRDSSPKDGGADPPPPPELGSCPAPATICWPATR